MDSLFTVTGAALDLVEDQVEEALGLVGVRTRWT